MFFKAVNFKKKIIYFIIINNRIYKLMKHKLNKINNYKINKAKMNLKPKNKLGIKLMKIKNSLI